MPRNWRCANGHAWTGDLGALTYCPDCGSSDVYEVRPQYESAVTPLTDVEAAAPSERTYVQPAAGKPGSAVERPTTANVGDTFVQSPSLKSNVGDTLVQTPAEKTSVGDTFVQPALSGSDTFV